jgi:SPP1 gp7 family putative phage head morphogenesis protein
MFNQRGYKSDWVEIPFTKKLSQSELEYLTSILLGYDRQLGIIAQYLGSEEYAELQFANQRQIDAFFRTSGIDKRLDEVINFNASTSEEFIKNFYRIGAELGYEDIEQTLAYTLADQEALFHVSKYNFDLITNVNQELKDGIKEVIFESVAEGEGYQTTIRKLQQLPLTPINTNISIRTRAEMIARTEYARAVNTGTLQAYANYGVEKVVINTSHDGLVCDYCLMLEADNPYTLQEAMKLLPAHPNCRCNYAAYIPEPDALDSFDIGSLSIVNNPLVVNLCPPATG